LADVYKGQCFCGEVAFEVTGEPAIVGYCHCDDCQSWMGAPINAFSLWPIDSVRVTKGEANLGAYSKTENSIRKFCKTCGGAVMTEHPTLGLIDVFTVLMPDFDGRPTLHVHYGHKKLSIKDGLPKFKDLPEEVGGSGEMLPE
jgi:hypothetical protein